MAAAGIKKKKRKKKFERNRDTRKPLNKKLLSFARKMEPLPE